MKRKKYKVTVENSDVFACSLVTAPAVEELFVAFNEEKPLVEKFTDQKKHMLTGIVAIPDKPIYRRDANGEEYDIVFSAEAIESLAKSYMKNFRQKNVTLQHQEDAEGIYMVEQWIKTNAEYDKSLALGFSKEIPVGTWFQTYYVDSNDIWKRVESGELRGFSLECVLGVEEQEFEAQEQVMEDANTTTATIEEPTVEVKESVLEKILSYLTPSFDKKEANVSESGEIKVSEEEGLVEVEKEEVKEDVNSESDGNGDSGNSDNADEQVPEEVNPLQDVVDNLKNELEELKKTNEGLLEKIKELGSQPSAKPINTNPKGNVTSSDNAFRNWRDTMRNLVN